MNAREVPRVLHRCPTCRRKRTTAGTTLMKLVSLAAIVLVALPSIVFGQFTVTRQAPVSEPSAGCGNFIYGPSSLGPLDYRTTPPDEINFVEVRHFPEHVERLIRGEKGSIAGDLAYTLRVFPNHPRALRSAAELTRRNGGSMPKDMHYSIACWFGRSRVGHLLKSRARVNVVRYSRLTGEDGSGSYELEFAEGGEAIVLGNLIQQGPSSQNQTIVSYGVEGYRWPDNTLTMAFNTIVNDRAKGSTFVRVSKGATHATLVNNLLVGRGSLAIDAPLTSMGNVEAARKEFANPDALDYRLRAASILVGRAGFRGAGDLSVRLPTREYTHEASCCALEGLTSLTPLSPGAFQRLAR